VTATLVKQSSDKTNEGRTHEELVEVWDKHRIPDAVKKASEWVTIPQKSDWVNLSSRDFKFTYQNDTLIAFHTPPPLTR